MNVSFNISTPSINTSQVGDTNQVQQTNSTDKTLTVSITTGAGEASGPGGATSITLSYPLVGPQDIALNEVMQQLQNLDLTALKGSTLTSAVLLLNQQIGDIAGDIIKGGKEFVEKNSEQLTKFFDGVEKNAKKVETQLFDLINNSTYPEFNDFLSKVLETAQQIRQAATAAKYSLVVAEYNSVLDQAKEMEVAAQKNYESTMKEIQASRVEAIGQIVSGSISVLGSLGGMGVGKLAGAGGLAGGQFGAGLGQALGQIATGAASLESANLKEDAAALKLEADMAGVIQKRDEATQKLIQAAESITDEIMNIGKSLSDMVLKLYQDFISSQSQIVQHANI